MAEQLYVKCSACGGTRRIYGGTNLDVFGNDCTACQDGYLPATEEQIEAASREITKRKMAEFMDRTGHYD